MKKPTSLHVWYTNADTLTHDKIRELSMEISASNIPPDIIAITEIVPKHCKRILQEEDYIIEGYTFEYENLSNVDSTRGVAIYVKSHYHTKEQGFVIFTAVAWLYPRNS